MVRFSHLGRGRCGLLKARCHVGAAYAWCGYSLPTRGKVLGPVPKAVYAWGERYG